MAHAQVLAVADRAEPAVRLIALAEAERERLGVVFPSWIARRRDLAETRARALLDDGEFAEAWEQGRTLTLDESAALALESLE